MKAFELVIECTMDDGAVLTAKVDQRDHAAFESSDLYTSEPPVTATTKTRWLAWNALRRTGQLDMPWRAFHFDQCAGAIVTAWPGMDEPEQTEQEGEQEPDPSLR